MKVFSRSIFAAATIVVATPVFAQQTTAAAAPAQGATCEIDQGRPQPVALAMLSLTKAQTAMKGGDPTPELKAVVTRLTAPNLKNENPVGRAYMLASAYVFLLEQPNIAAVMPRGAVGIATNPTATIDLFAAADSMISTVEQSSPACAQFMAPFRQQKAWLNVTNAAINALNANQLDSAEVFANRSLTLDKSSPYPYTVLASVAKTRNNNAAVIEYSKKVVEASGNDSSYADVKDRAIFEIAAAQTAAAEKATGADKQRLAREAAASWAQLTNSKDPLQSQAAVANLQKTYMLAGDSAQLGKIYAPMIADPSKYSEGALLQAGVIASQFKRPDDAALLFEGVVARNQYSRDGLNNLAASYLQAGETTKAIPVIDKLVALDPSNPDNWMLYAYGYVGKLKTTKDPKLTKAYNDSLVLFNTRSEKMPVRVAFTEFTRNSEGTTLAGTIENRGTAAKTYPLAIELLGANGEVIYTETANVGPVAPKATKEFRIKTDKTGVAGYRYKPLT
jgi:tetratricopeptide (TPR) repeat protein